MIGISDEEARRMAWIEDHPKSNPFNGLEILQDVLRMEKRSNVAQAQQPPSRLPPVKLNTESITPLSREKLRLYLEIAGDLLN